MVTQIEFEDAKDKVMMGAERKSLVMTEEEKLLTAYHEGGHAIVALNVKATDPVHKATIIPRGHALGMVMQLPERDKLLDEPRADDLAPRHHDGRPRRRGTGVRPRRGDLGLPASDIEQATKLARMMVTRWGLSEELGTVAYGENQEEVFLGYSVARQQNISESTAQKIDTEIRRLVEETRLPRRPTTSSPPSAATRPICSPRACSVRGRSPGDEIKDLLNGKRPRRESVIEPSTPRSSAVPNAGKPRPRTDTGGMEPQPQS